MYNVLIVDDQKSSRELMRYIISESKNYTLVGSIENAQEAKDFIDNKRVDLVLMDIHTGGKENGIDCSKKIKEVHPNVKIIIVTFMVQQAHIEEARNAGCEGFWYKDHSATKLIEVMDSVMSGISIYPDKLPVITVGKAKTTDFTKKETTILSLKVNGYANAEICEKLSISRSTLNFHLNNLKVKSGYDSILKLVIDVSMKKFVLADDFEKE